MDKLDAMKPYIGGIVRSVVAAVGGYVAGKGWITPENWDAFVAAGSTMGVIAWSMYQKYMYDMRTPGPAPSAE